VAEASSRVRERRRPRRPSGLVCVGGQSVSVTVVLCGRCRLRGTCDVLDAIVVAALARVHTSDLDVCRSSVHTVLRIQHPATQLREV